jgi:putative ABC transport system substrate-binding protein
MGATSGAAMRWRSERVRDSARGSGSLRDRILRGEKPSELPVQQPTKFKVAFNLKTAKVLDVTIPESFLLQADEVIE